jgi:hypothetical protein
MENQHKTTNPASSEELKRARRIAVVLASLISLAILCLTYGHLQKTAADENLALANQYKIEAEEQRRLASESREKTEKLTKELSVAIKALQECKN